AGARGDALADRGCGELVSNEAFRVREEDRAARRGGGQGGGVLARVVDGDTATRHAFAVAVANDEEGAVLDVHLVEREVRLVLEVAQKFAVVRVVVPLAGANTGRRGKDRSRRGRGGGRGGERPWRASGCRASVGSGRAAGWRVCVQRGSGRGSHRSRL